MINDSQIKEAMKELVHALVDVYFATEGAIKPPNITDVVLPENWGRMEPIEKKPVAPTIPAPVNPKPVKAGPVAERPGLTTAGKARICVICGELKGITVFESGGGIICGLCRKKGISPLITESIKKSKELGLYPFTSKRDFDGFMNDIKQGKYVKSTM